MQPRTGSCLKEQAWLKSRASALQSAFLEHRLSSRKTSWERSWLRIEAALSSAFSFSSRRVTELGDQGDRLTFLGTRYPKKGRCRPHLIGRFLPEVMAPVAGGLTSEDWELQTRSVKLPFCFLMQWSTRAFRQKFRWLASFRWMNDGKKRPRDRTLDRGNVGKTNLTVDSA